MSWNPASAPLRVAVLAGGSSAEREISLESGANVLAALDAAGHVAVAFDPAECDLAEIAWGRFDACFIALHGGAGEDGRLQRRLDLLKVCYTGSGPDASRLAMSKSAAKERFRAAGVPTADYVLFHAADSVDAIVARVDRLGFPLIVKPDSQGSSLGVGLAASANDLPPLVAQCLRYEPYAVAEPLLTGREFTVALLGREPLPALEIVPQGRLFDYEAKYRAAATQYRFETGLPDSTLAEIEQVAIGAAEALGTRGLARVDLILDHAGRPWVLEVNTVPGLTDHSLAPKAAARAGLNMPALCDRLVRETLAVELVR